MSLLHNHVGIAPRRLNGRRGPIHRYAGGPPPLLEPLEARQLLSAAIQVTGNGTVIPNHDTTLAITDFTNFGPASATFSAAIGSVSRTFVISDTGDAPLTLTRRITITGPDPNDFLLTASPPTTIISPGTPRRFIITFRPTANGPRFATVTISSNDPAAPTFNFKIRAASVPTVALPNALQVATVGAGTGTPAIRGAALTLQYTTYTLHSEVDSNVGGTPMNVTLGFTSVIAGWTQGLAGIRQGETRFLAVPASLAYGNQAHGSIPPNSSLIFMVTALSVANPVLQVSGNGVPIAFNDQTPSAADGTYLGATPPGSTAPLSATYTITNGSAGLVAFPFSPVVVVQSQTANNFSVSAITINSAATSATFTVTYTPGQAGTQRALIDVRSSDPLHGNFTFAVAATTVVNYLPIGHVDAINTAVVSGWTLDPNSPATSLSVRIVIDGANAGTVTANIPRPGLVRTYGSADHGFSFTMPTLTPGNHTVSVYAIDSDTGRPQLLRSAIVANLAPIGHVDAINTTAVRGWTLDPNSPAASLTVRVDIDGVTAGTVTANIPRPGLVPVYGSADHGFSFTMPTLTSGNHTVNVYAIDAQTGLANLLASQTLTV